MKRYLSFTVSLLLLLLGLCLSASSARAATLPNAWQIADVSTSGGVLGYFTNLTAAQRLAATNDGWRFTMVSRLVEGSGGAGPAHFMVYGNGIRRFVVGWDTNAAGQLTAATFGSPNTTNIVTTTASAATNAYHTHDLVYDPLTQQATYLFDGISIQTWGGLTPDANQNGTPQWGTGSSAGKGRMNYHQVQFAISGLGTVAQYDAGLQGAPAIAPNPQTQGWNTNLPAVVNAVTNAPVSPDTVPLPATMVINTNDSGPGSLRAAITNASSGATITFSPALNGQTIVLTSGELAIRTNLSILGPGATILSIKGSGANRVFFITNNVTCTLVGITITNGVLFGAGGGILNQGSLIVSNCVLSGNTGSYGGGICNDGTLTVKNCTFARNSAGINGGGLSNGGTATVQNSTFSGNTAVDYGGGIDNGGQLESGGTLVLQNSTLTGNSGAESGGGLHAAIGMEHLTNCIIAGNFSGPIGFGPDINCAAGRVESAAYNLIGSTNNVVGIVNGVNGNIVANGSGGALLITSILDTNLSFNGGPTRTHALVAGSPALNSGLSSGAAGLSFDQRGSGFPRIAFGSVDIGAFESQVIPLTVTGIIAGNKVYNGTTSAALNSAGATLVGVIAGDSVTLNTAGASGTFASKDVGANIPVTVSGLTLSGAQAAKYTLTQPTATANITPKALTVTGVTANNKLYDGTTAATLNTAGATVVGVIAGDAVTLNTAGASGTFPIKNVGIGITVTVTGLTLSGPQAGNYTLTQPSTTASITPRPLTVTAAINTKLYDGTTSAAAIPTITSGSLAPGDTANFIETYADSSVGNAKFLTPSGTVNDGSGGINYSITFVSTKTGTITSTPPKAPVANNESVTVTANTATVSITLTASDPNSPPASLAYIVTSGPAHGTLSGTAPNLTYTSNAGYTGPDSFQFKVNNGAFDSNLASFSITLVPNPLGITCSTNIVAVSTGGLTPVSYTVTATNLSGPVPVTCVPPSGTGFLVGTSNVVCSATSGNTVTCGFTVTVCATNITVTTTNDNGAGSLRQALVDICPGGTIDFASTLNGRAIGLTNGELLIQKNLNILGPGATNLAISGKGVSRVLHISTNATCLLAGLAITNGHAAGVMGTAGGGGGAYNDQGSLTVRNCVFSGNLADALGGGIFNSGSASLTILNSTLSGNSATNDGGGIINFGTLTIQNSTLSGNTSQKGAGGINNQIGAVVLQNCTITGNRGFTAGGLAAHLTDRLTNCIVVGNGFDISGSVQSAAFNLIGRFGLGATNGNIVFSNTLPLTSILDTNLAFNGGSTPTHALAAGSPAVNAGTNVASLPAYDQRGAGFPRVAGGRVDMGAFELQVNLPMITCPGSITTSNTTGQCSAIVPFSVASDSPFTCQPPSGTTFPIGTNTVTCTATNVVGTNTCSFKVVVRDAEAPAFNCLDLAASTPPGFTTVAVNFSPQANDNCSGALTPSCSPPSGTAFFVGTNNVTCTAVDAAGNTNSCSFNVVVTAVPAFVATDAGLVAGLPGVSDGAVTWADFDGDGRLDLFLSGETANQFTRISRLYRNSGGSNLVAQALTLPGLHFNTAAWADYNLDGDLDLLLSGDSGAPYTQLYRNDGGGTFTPVASGLPALVSSAAAWGDFDHDGLPDLLLCGSPDGSTPQTRLYRNCGDGHFADVSANLPDVVLGAAAWADFDGDGNLDLALMGFDGTQDVVGIYQGHGNGTFTEVGGLALGFEAGAVAWGDFNNDGYPDVIFTGESDGVARTVLYRNDPDGNGGRNFEAVDNSRLPDVKDSTVAWGDFNNDGLPDIVIGGATRLFSPPRQAGIYLNNGAGQFNILPAGVPALERARVACGDFNGDGRLDVLITGYTGTNRLTRLLLNNTTLSNTPPSVPTGLSVGLTTNGVTLGWARANDVETPGHGLSYNVRVSGPNGRPFVVAASAALNNGARLLPAFGNVGQTNRWSLGHLALPTGNYTWNVQAIDSAFTGSAFSSNGTFCIQQPLLTQVGPNGTAFGLSFTGSNLTYHVEATGDLRDCGLSQWQRLGEATTNAPGQFQFLDLDNLSHPRRFYRLLWP